MAVIDNCEAQFATPIPEERTCPKCGETVEVFTRKGRVIEDSTCPKCGHVISAEELLEAQPRKAPK